MGAVLEHAGEPWCVQEFVPDSMTKSMKVALKSSNPRKLKSALRNIRRLELNTDTIKQNAIIQMLE